MEDKKKERKKERKIFNGRTNLKELCAYENNIKIGN